MDADSPDARTTPHVPAAGDAGEPTPERVGRFEVRAVLGRGSFGVVYRAFDPHLERDVALKIPRDLSGDDAGARFLAEARAASRLRHPGIVGVHEAGRAGEAVYIASEYVDGVTLAAAVYGGPLPPREAVRIVRDLAVAIGYAHASGVVHRDLKPANVMLAAGGRPQVMDFGLARLLDAAPAGPGGDPTATTTLAGGVIGSPAYMAPEQARGEPATPASDQYALGVVLYELLTGQRPLSGTVAQVIALLSRDHPFPPPRELRPDVPRDLDAVCMRALSARHRRRYPDADAFALDLTRWLGGQEVSARPVSGPERWAKWARRRPALAAVSGAAALSGVLFLGALGWVAHEQGLRATQQAAADDENKKVASDLRAERERLTDELRAVAGLNCDIAREAGLRRVEAGAVPRGLHDLVGALWDADDMADDALRRETRADLLTASRRLVPLRCRLVALAGDRDAGSQGVARLSPDGRVVLVIDTTYDEKNLGRLLDTRTGEPIGARLPEWEDAAFSADGTTVLVRRDGSGEVRLFDARTGEPLGPGLPVAYRQELVATPDLGRVVTQANPAPPVVTDSRTGKPAPGFAQPGPARLWAFAPDGRLAASVAAAGPVPNGGFAADLALRFWDAATGAPVGEPLPVPPSNREPGPLAFSADGSTLLFDRPGLLRWDVSTRTPLNAPLPADLAHKPDRDSLPTPVSNALKRLALRRPPCGQPTSRHDALFRDDVPTVHHGGWQEHVHAAAFSPDGRTVFTGTGPDVVSTDLATGKRRVWPTRHHGPVAAVVPSPDGRVLLTGSSDRTAVAWDIATGRPLAPPLRLPEPVWSVGFLLGGRTAFAEFGNTSRRQTHLWDFETGAPVGHPLEGGSPMAAGDGDALLTDCNAVWDLSSVVPAARLPADALALALSPDGGTLLVACPGQLRRYRPAGGAEVAEPVPFANATAVAFRPDGKRVAVAVGKEVRTLDASTLAPVGPPLLHDSDILALDWGANGSRLVVMTTLGDSGRVTVWDADAGRPVAPPVGLCAPPLRLTPDGAEFRSRGHGGDAPRRIDLASLEWAGRVRAVTSPEEIGWDRDTLVRPDGGAFLERNNRKLYAPGPAGIEIQFDHRANEQVRMDITPGGGYDSGTALPFWTADNKTIVYPNPLLLRVNAATGKQDGPGLPLADECRNPEPHRNGLKLVAVGPDSRTLLTRDGADAIRTRDLHTGATLFPPFVAPQCERSSFYDPRWVAFAPDSRRVLLSAEAGERDRSGARLWDLATGKPLGPVLAHPAKGRDSVFVLSAAFRPDGAAVATGGSDGAARLWNPVTGEELCPPLVHTNSNDQYVKVVAIAFSPDGSRLITQSESGQVYYWDAKTGERIGTIVRSDDHRSGSKPLAFDPDGTPVLLGPLVAVPPRAPEHVRPEAWPYPPVYTDTRGRTALSPDGRFTLTGGANGEVWAHDAGSGLPVGPPHRLGAPVTALAFSPDGQTVFAAADGRVWRWPAPHLLPTERPALTRWLEARSGWRWAREFSTPEDHRKRLRSLKAAERQAARREEPTFRFLTAAEWAAARLP